MTPINAHKFHLNFRFKISRIFCVSIILLYIVIFYSCDGVIKKGIYNDIKKLFIASVHTLHMLRREIKLLKERIIYEFVIIKSFSEVQS